jgi:hypothetical protein
MSTDDDTYPGQTTPRECSFNGGACTFEGQAVCRGRSASAKRHDMRDVGLEGNIFVVRRPPRHGPTPRVRHFQRRDVSHQRTCHACPACE